MNIFERNLISHLELTRNDNPDFRAANISSRTHYIVRTSLNFNNVSADRVCHYGIFPFPFRCLLYLYRRRWDRNSLSISLSDVPLALLLLLAGLRKAPCSGRRLRSLSSTMPERLACRFWTLLPFDL